MLEGDSSIIMSQASKNSKLIGISNLDTANYNLVS